MAPSDHLSTSAGRTAWLLTDDRPGNRSQAVGVARALGWPTEEKPLAFNELAERPTPLLPISLETIDDASRAGLTPPWPDLVIAAGRRTVVIARWIRRESGDRTRVVLLGRKTPTDFGDLSIRAAYFKQPEDPRLLQLVLPPIKVDAAALAQAVSEDGDPLAGLARPRCVFLVGGPTDAHSFRPDFADRMARDVAAAAEAAGAALAIVTSRRTTPEAVAALRAAAPQARFFEWRQGGPRAPYLALLAQSDLLVVTGESESMISEAAAAEKPLTIYPLAAKPLKLKSRVRGRIADLSLGDGPFAGVCRRIIGGGWVTVRRDLAQLHRTIEERGWGEVFRGGLNLRQPAPQDESGLVKRRIEALF